MRHLPILLVCFSLPLAACSNGNVRAPGDYYALRPPAVAHPFYDPFAAYGEANATWLPPVIDRNGTIVKPWEPSTQASRPHYEQAPWATGAAGGSRWAPVGTF